MQLFNPHKLARITIVTGHYGSGKTEFSVSLAMLIASNRAQSSPPSRIALIDLDIVNPYFRSRERRETLEKAGVSVYGSAYKEEITAELPALGADIRTPLEDKNAQVIIDLGGNDSGAIILNQFAKYLTGENAMMAAVINANRPDTRTADGALEHITAIEAATGQSITHLVNNTHLLRETTAGDIKKGFELCCDVSAKTGKSLLCSCYPNGIVNPNELGDLAAPLMPLGLYMRPSFLDR